MIFARLVPRAPACGGAISFAVVAPRDTGPAAELVPTEGGGA